MVFTQKCNSEQLKILAGIVAALIGFLSHIWSQWARTTLIILLIDDANEALVVEIVQTLKEKLK